MGQDGIERTIKSAREAGQVLDAELIERAAELDQAFSNVAATIGSELQGSIVNAGWQLYHFIQQFQDFQSRTTSSLDQSMRDLGAERVRLEAEILQIERDQRESGGHNGMIFESRLGDARERLESILEEERRILDVLESRQPPAAVEMDMPGTGPTWGDFSDTFSPSATSGGGGRADATSEIDRQRDAVKNLIAGLEFEKSLIGLSAIEQEKMTLLRQAGAAATEDQKKAIERLIAETHNEQMRVEQLQATFDMLGQVGMSAVQGIIGALDDGKITAQEFGSILSGVLSMAANFFLNQAFGGFGALFGVTMAQGGPVRGPGTETSDSIPALLSNGEFVVNAKAARKHYGLLDWLNSGGSVLQRAMGGPVPSPTSDEGPYVIVPEVTGEIPV